MLFWYLNGKPLENFNIDLVREGKKIILFGADRERNKCLFEYINEGNIKCLFDNNEEKWNTYIDGIPVVKPYGETEDVVLISGIYNWKDITDQIKELGYKNIYFFLAQEIQDLVGKYISEFSPAVYNNAIIEGRTYKYIHFMPDEKFFYPVIEFIEYGLNAEEHFFVIYRMNEANLNDQYNVWSKYKEVASRYHNIYLNYCQSYCLNLIDWEKNRSKIDNILENAEKVILHGEFLSPKICTYLHDKIDLIKKKGIFVPWGGNIGKDPYTVYTIKRVLQYSRMIAYSFSQQKETIIKYFPIAKKAIWFNNELSYVRPTYAICKKKEGIKKVLIAHSPHDYTKVVETLKYLSDIKTSINIYCITSYGPKEMKKKVEYYGNKYYGNHFIAVKEYMDYKEYVDFLSSMDLAVFGMEDLSGRDTLELLFWLGVKVYLKPNFEASECMKEIGYRINDYYAAKSEINDGLFYNQDKDWNCSIAADKLDPEKKLRQWKEFYEYDFQNGSFESI